MAIHTSIGTSTANSYVSVASANTYFTARENVDSWDNIDGSTNATAAETRKENLLIMATREIDRNKRYFEGKYNQGIIGDATNYQALEFPRSSNVDANAALYIPEEIKYATYEQALWILERKGNRRSSNDPAQDRQTIGDKTREYLDGWVSRRSEWQ